MFCKARMVSALTSITRINTIKQISKKQQQQIKVAKEIQKSCSSVFLALPKYFYDLKIKEYQGKFS